VAQALIQDLVLKWKGQGGLEAKETGLAETGPAAEPHVSLLGSAAQRSAAV
jgi:hypothetical protein